MHAYAEACRALGRARVPYLVVGAFGINLYAERAGTVITTADCDLFLPADAGVLLRAIRTLDRLGYSFEAGGEPLVARDPETLAGIVRHRANVVAFRKGAQIDLALRIAGRGFASLWRRQRRFRVGGAAVRVASLEDLIRSKILADRPKDRMFLASYRDALDGLLRSGRRRKGSVRPRRRGSSKP